MAKAFSVLLSVALLTITADLLARGGPGSNGGSSSGGGDLSSSDLSAAEIANVLFMREEEKLARDSYIVLDELWGQQIYANIAASEQQHMDAIKGLLETYGLEDPVVDETVVGGFVNPGLDQLFNDLMDQGQESALAGLNVGGIIEETDMRDIQAAIDEAAHTDIIRVFENLLCGSRNHLRSFVKNIELSGSVYTATVLTQDEVDAIATSPMEQCGRKR